MIKARTVLLILSICALIALGVFNLSNTRPLADEYLHTKQITAYSNGVFGIDKMITTPPFFHSVHAGIYTTLKRITGIKLTAQQEITLYRTVSAVASILCLLLIGHLARKYLPTHEDQKWYASPFVFSAIFLFGSLPFVTPFLPLVYTDIPAILFLLFSIHFAVSKKPYRSAGMLLCAALIRQPILVWGLIPFWITISASFQDYKALSPIPFKKIIFKCSGFFIVFALFALFVLVNNGIALGDRRSHPLGLNLTNLWFFLTLWAIFFLPDFIKGLKHALIFIREQDRKYLFFRHFIISLLIFLPLLIYTTFYSNPHRYNSLGLGYFIRNLILVAIKKSTLLLSITSILGTLSIFSIFFVPQNLFTKLQDKFVLMGTTALALITLPLVEQRYYLPFFAIYICTRTWQNDSRWFLVWIFLLSLLAIFTTYSVFTGAFFI